MPLRAGQIPFLTRPRGFQTRLRPPQQGSGAGAPTAQADPPDSTSKPDGSTITPANSTTTPADGGSGGGTPAAGSPPAPPPAQDDPPAKTPAVTALRVVTAASERV